MSNVYSIDGQDFDLDTLPKIGLLASRAIAHIVRNEAASAVRAKLIGEARDAKRTKSGDSKADLTDDERRAIKYDAESAVHKAMYTAEQTLKANAIREGRIGEPSVGGPRKSEFDKRVESLVKRTVLAQIQSKLKLWVGQKKHPAADQTFTYKGADGPVTRTFGDMTAAYYAKNKVAVDRHVQKAMDDEAKAAERAAKSEGEGLDY